MSLPGNYRNAPVLRHIRPALFIVIAVFTLLYGNLTAQQAGAEGGFAIARLKYGGGGDWYGNQSSIENLLAYIRQQTDVDVNLKEARVELSDDDIFSYPYIFMTGHGNVRFSESEVLRLRRYLTNGGFLHADDNYGMDEFLRREMKKVFSDKEWIELPFDHDIYHAHFEFPDGIPKIHEHDGGPGKGLALFHEGRMIVYYSLNTDLSDGWEDPDVHNDPPETREAALRMGVNIVVYVLSH
ncbi:DUF4159 domain-containing protein [candidate division KSB1 bacterium]